MTCISNKNIVLRGNAGSGKTFWAKALAYYLCDRELSLHDALARDPEVDGVQINEFVKGEYCEFIQVHPSMRYDDVIYGIEITASGTMQIAYCSKRIKKICDAAQKGKKLYCIILDDISRNDISALLGNAAYAIKNRDQELSLPDGAKLVIPNNVIFIFTLNPDLCQPHSMSFLYSCVDYIHDFLPDENKICGYYLNKGAARIGEFCRNILHDVTDFINTNRADRNISPHSFIPGIGMFLVPVGGDFSQIYERLREKLKFQLFPYLRQLWKDAVVIKNTDALIAGIEESFTQEQKNQDDIAAVEKIFISSNKNVTDFDLQSTFQYYKEQIIGNNCAEFRGVLECIIDAILLNNILPKELIWNSILTNTAVGYIENANHPGDNASFLVEQDRVNDFFYTTPRNGNRVIHSYFSAIAARVGRWRNTNDTVGYRIKYSDGHLSKAFIPLNGFRCHNFTIDQPRLHPDNNTAEIYRTVFRLLNKYLDLYSNSILGIQGKGSLYNYILLEKKYLTGIDAELREISGELNRQKFFITKYVNFRTVWQASESEINVKPVFFEKLVSGETVFSVAAFEEIFCEAATDSAQKITLKGAHKMTNLNDYQRIMENISVHQMIFQGPPGTSKTFESKLFILQHLNPAANIDKKISDLQGEISKKLEAFKLTENDYQNPQKSPKIMTGGWDLVQFHPSYGYEDFIRGIEVKAEDGHPLYFTVNKILGKIAEFASFAEKAKSKAPFYLLIDEINRANLAAVFGELIYGLEYRGNAISTPYEIIDKSTKQLTHDIALPPNLFIIGTMNTADKSIDSIDYAIRRRFIFIDSPPKREIVLSCYQNISRKNDEASVELFFYDAVQSIFDNTRFFNDEYKKNDVRLGHTYFLRSRKDDYISSFIEKFVFQIIPILREYLNDGILTVVDDTLLKEESSTDSIYNESSKEKQTSMLGTNIILYVKEFGNLNSDGQRIDNAYIGRFIEELCVKMGF